VNGKSLSVYLSSANSCVILILETNRNDWVGIVRVIGFVEMSAFDLSLFHIRVLDIYEPVVLEVQKYFKLHTSLSCISQLKSASRLTAHCNVSFWSELSAWNNVWTCSSSLSPTAMALYKDAAH
jgi:hypothetical protein